MSSPCPPPKTFRSYLNGKFTDAETESFETHLVNCARCQADLEIMSEESDSLSRLVAATAKVPQMAGIVGGASPVSFVGFVPLAQRESSVSEDLGDRDSMIGDYRILECIGQGGMGSVHRALDVRLNRYVAVKVLKSERMGTPEAISRFEREMRLLAQFDHKHIVTVFGGGEHDGVPYFVMELVTGVNLSQLLKRLGPLPVPEACSIIQLAASALQYAHNQKVIHRDIKPSNLMITAKGDVQLLDLGLAQILEMEGEALVSRADQVLGTLAYMSPEQLNGRHHVTLQSDIFSLGITLHELLTGQRPYERPGMPPIVSDIRSLRPDVDKDLNALVQDMIALDPAERPSSMAEVESRLHEIYAAKNLSDLVAEYYRWDNRTLPRSTSNLAKLKADSKNAKRAASKLSARTRPKKWIVGLAVAGAIAALVGWVNYPVRTGAVEVDAEPGVPSDLVSQGGVIFKNIDTDKRYPLTQKGTLDLPVGKYLVEYRGPDEFLNDGNDFEVFEGQKNKLKLNPRLAKIFQYPDIPDKAGANATYHGPLWRSGWDEEAVPFSFKIYLEVLAIEANSDTPVTKWLQIDVDSKDGEDDYRESALLNMDSKRWDNEKFLEINKGWIEARSSRIKDFMKRLGSDEKIVVPFSREHDLLAENEAIPLPKRRLSVQDVLSLFFGQDMPGAGKSINSTRARLPSIGERKAWIEPVHDARSPVLCYVVSSRDRNADKSTFGFMMARTRNGPSNPFGFVRLEVNSDELKADCRIMNCSEGVPDTERTKRRSEALAENLFDPSRAMAVRDAATADPMQGTNDKRADRKPPNKHKPIPLDPSGWRKRNSDTAYQIGLYLSGSSLPSKVLSPQPQPDGRFDLAVIPRVPSMQVYHGNISLDKDHTETIRATIKSLGDEQIESRLYRWIEAEVVTNCGNGPDYREAARVLIDAEIYDRSGDFVIKRGWIAYESEEAVFMLPADGNLESLVDLRLPFQRKLDLDRIGVSHVLSMLFNADIKPRNAISRLRAEFAGAFNGLSRGQGVPADFRSSGRPLSCLVYKPPKLLSFSNQMDYCFQRSTEVPFGFVTASLTFLNLKISLETESFRSLDPKHLPPSIIGSREALNESMMMIAKDPLQAFPNWRVWTWNHSGKTYKAWAEFGGTIESPTGVDVLLRDQSESEIRVPTNLLSNADRASLLKGRLWGKNAFGDKFSLWRTLDKDDVNSNSLYFLIPDSPGESVKTQFGYCNPVDKRWIEKLRAARKQNSDSMKTPDAWQAFAGYVR